MKSKKSDDDLWKWLLGAAAVGGTAYGVAKHFEAKEQASVALRATERAEAAAREAASSHTRARKLAMEIASTANTKLAHLQRADAPLLRFEGCFAAATNGLFICIDMNWLLTGIVDPAKEVGAIWGRVVGALAHEWFHFLDTARGTRDSHGEELLADAFAGKQLARLQVPPDPFAELLSRFPQSLTHPHGELRAKKVVEAHAAEIAKTGW